MSDSFFTPQALAMFEERKRSLQPLAQNNPYRHPPNKRTWWDWQEIKREDAEDHWMNEAGTRRLHKALCMAPSLEILEALLTPGETVPIERLRPEAVKAYGLR